MIASLPMYDLEEVSAAHDFLWGAIAARLRPLGVAAPATLTRAADPASIWTDPDLLLGQTCGYPLVTTLAAKVQLVATPCYRAPGCEGPFYRSAIVVRATDEARSLADLRGRRCAVNGADSNSGMNVLRAQIAKLPREGGRFFDTIVTTGGHAASVAAVADGSADVAAIDCVTWAQLQRLRPHTTGALRVLDWSVASPGLPLITALRTSDATRAALARVLTEVGEDPALEAARDALLLTRFAVLPLGAYDTIAALERSAVALGYPVLQ